MQLDNAPGQRAAHSGEIGAQLRRRVDIMCPRKRQQANARDEYEQPHARATVLDVFAPCGPNTQFTIDRPQMPNSLKNMKYTAAAIPRNKKKRYTHVPSVVLHS